MGLKNSFECNHCNKCCQLLVIPITKKDYDRLLKWKKKENISDANFFGFFTFASYGKFDKPVVQLRSPCPFLNFKGCSVYKFRPDVCRIYPFEVAPLEAKEQYKNFIYSKKKKEIELE